MALALSASLAQSESAKLEDLRDMESQILRESSPQPCTSSDPPIHLPPMPDSVPDIPEIILPGAVTWKKPTGPDNKMTTIGDVCSPVSLVEIGLRGRRDA